MERPKRGLSAFDDIERLRSLADFAKLVGQGRGRHSLSRPHGLSADGWRWRRFRSRDSRRNGAERAARVGHFVGYYALATCISHCLCLSKHVQTRPVFALPGRMLEKSRRPIAARSRADSRRSFDGSRKTQGSAADPSTARRPEALGPRWPARAAASCNSRRRCSLSADGRRRAKNRARGQVRDRAGLLANPRLALVAALDLRRRRFGRRHRGAGRGRLWRGPRHHVVLRRRRRDYDHRVRVRRELSLSWSARRDGESEARGRAKDLWYHHRLPPGDSRRAERSGMDQRSSART